MPSSAVTSVGTRSSGGSTPRACAGCSSRAPASTTFPRRCSATVASSRAHAVRARCRSRSGSWRRSSRGRSASPRRSSPSRRSTGTSRIPRSDRVEGSTLALVGLGGIGAAVASRALAFGMEVRALRRTDAPSPVEGVQVVADARRSCCRVPPTSCSPHPRPRGTRHLIDADAFASMTPGVHLVNIARGALVDQDALRMALDDGPVAMATLDTVDPEPLPAGHWLYTHPKVRLAAHISWYTPQLQAAAVDILVDNVGRFLRGEPLLHTSTPTRVTSAGRGRRRHRLRLPRTRPRTAERGLHRAGPGRPGRRPHRAPGRAARRAVRVHVAGRGNGHRRRRRGHDRDSARHACRARDRGLCRGPPRGVREAVRARRDRGGAHARGGGGCRGDTPRRSRVPLGDRPAARRACDRGGCDR